MYNYIVVNSLVQGACLGHLDYLSCVTANAGFPCSIYSSVSESACPSVQDIAMLGESQYCKLYESKQKNTEHQKYNNTPFWLCTNICGNENAKLSEKSHIYNNMYYEAHIWAIHLAI